ncbi:SDR family oxidoreductase [Uliginosibacterium sp. H3]|uniref:SDR family oxidoreductase n=1 Tax=Uliginosibacterium silvisoli TaxID=3114758 RepID=A0ABU6K280_9RHOO|nr:SDR family oxidoreductase [Uliginosibacterium sp. H3]
MDLGIAGKRALVLGGNRGIGFGIARALVQEGVNVAIAARDMQRLEQAAAELRAEGGGAVACFSVDLRDPDGLAAFADRVAESFGAIDILVNNTGGPEYGGASNRGSEAWRGSFEEMVMSVIALTDAVLPGMRLRGWGRVLTVVSSGVVQPLPVLGISNSLRGALLGWSKTLSSEVAAEGVTVNILVPGRIDTERVRLTDEAVAEREGITADEAQQRSTSVIPLKRYGSVEEFGAVAAFVASERASYMTGSMVRCDGGIIRSV